MPVIDNGPFPVLVNVTDCIALEEPTFVAPNVKLDADNPTAGCTPVPLSEILCGESLALSVIVTAAVIAPVAVGAKRA
jgi:hypothetical protein